MIEPFILLYSFPFSHYEVQGPMLNFKATVLLLGYLDDGANEKADVLGNTEY